MALSEYQPLPYQTYLSGIEKAKEIGELPRDAQEAREEILARWQVGLTHPLWYTDEILGKDLEAHILKDTHGDITGGVLRTAIYALTEGMLARHEIPLATIGPDYDRERPRKSDGQPNILYFIVHESENDPKTTFQTINAINFLRVYARGYRSGDVLGHDVTGQPIWSNHILNGEMVFSAYTWGIASYGQAIRLLNDEHIGWQAGRWKQKHHSDPPGNVESVGVVLVGDYEHAIPPDEQLDRLANIIVVHYPDVPLNETHILGHSEVSIAPRTCPGEYWTVWKRTVLQKAQRIKQNLS